MNQIVFDILLTIAFIVTFGFIPFMLWLINYLDKKSVFKWQQIRMRERLLENLGKQMEKVDGSVS